MTREIPLTQGKVALVDQINGKKTYLGVYPTETDAARAYDDFARSSFGEFACVNFPRAGERAALAVL